MKAICITTLIIITLMSLVRPVYRDWVFVCENTGSRNQYTQWFFGLRTGEMYRRSALEEFIQHNYHDLLEHRWTSLAGTGKNVLGIPVLFGHGRPGAISHIRLQILDEWVQSSKPEQVLQFYLLMRSNASESEKRERVDAVFNEMIDRR